MWLIGLYKKAKEIFWGKKITNNKNLVNKTRKRSITNQHKKLMLIRKKKKKKIKKKTQRAKRTNKKDLNNKNFIY